MECIKNFYLLKYVSYKKYIMIVVESMIDESYLSFIHNIIITSTREATIKTIKTINFDRDSIAMWSQFININLQQEKYHYLSIFMNVKFFEQ